MAREVRHSLPDKVTFAMLVTLIVVATLAYGTVHQPALILFYLVVTVAGLTVAVDGLVRGELRFSRHPLQLPLLGAVVYAFIQLIPFGTRDAVAGVEGISRTISIEPFWTQMFALHLIALLAFFSVLLVLIDSAARLRALVMTLTVFGFLLAFFGILQSVLSPTKIYGLYDAAKPFGPYVNRHNFAAVMEMMISLPLGMLISGAIPRDKRLIYVTAIGLMGIGLILSGSRGGLVSIIAAVTFMLFASETRPGEQRSTWLRAALAVLLVAVVIVGAALIGGETSFMRISETVRSEDVTTNRLAIWAVTWKVIKFGFPFGVGIGAFASGYAMFDPANGSQRVEQAHNDYLQVLADAGVVGAVLAAFFIWRLMRDGLRASRSENSFRRGVALGALGACFAVLVHSLFDFVLHTTSVTLIFLTMAALVVASGRVFRDDEESTERRRRKKENVTPIRTTGRRESAKG